MDLYENTINAVKEFINSNRNIFYDNRDRFRVAASALNAIAYVYENYGGEACKLFLKDKGKERAKRGFIR
jgi:retron-type reverse transcriptase